MQASISTRIDIEVYKQLQDYCLNSGDSIANSVNEAIKLFLGTDNRESKPAPKPLKQPEKPKTPDIPDLKPASEIKPGKPEKQPETGITGRKVGYWNDR